LTPRRRLGDALRTPLKPWAHPTQTGPKGPRSGPADPRRRPPIRASIVARAVAASPRCITGGRTPRCRPTHLLPCTINHRRPGTRRLHKPRSCDRCATLTHHRHGQEFARAPRPHLDSASCATATQGRRKRAPATADADRAWHSRAGMRRRKRWGGGGRWLCLGFALPLAGAGQGEAVPLKCISNL
jgi:hypothetical protein